jgi:hypothetical protein
VIQLGLAYVTILLIISAVIWAMKRPPVAIGLLVSLYAAEQILVGSLPLLSTYPQAYNFFIGGVCLAAMGIALVRFGLPRPPLDYLGAFAALFFLVCASLAWTSSPFLGTQLVKHFTAAIPFAILLPIATLRNVDDFKPPIQISILLAVIVALGIISSPLIESYSGRTHLAEGWTVLSPAEFTSVAFIFLVILERRFLGFLATFRLPIAVVLALGTLLTGARAQFLLAIGIAGAIRLARLYRTQLTGILATIAMALISILIACLVMFSDVNIPSFRASDRFTTESMGQGFEVRLGFIRESLTLDSPVFGNGIGAWSYMHNRVDVKPGQKESLTLHPHNSLAEAYFEFGAVGLLLFCSILYIGARNARLLLIRYKIEPELGSLTAAITAYFIYSFLLSLKQSTFLAAIGLYLSVSMLCALVQMHRTETQESTSIKDPILSD